MPLLVHSGTAAIDLSASQTARDDISDVLMASLVVEPNLMGICEIAEPFAAEQLYWVEDSLNPFKVTTLVSLASLASSTAYQTSSLSVSQSDAAVLDVGYILEADTLVGTPGAEQMQVITISGQSLTVNRNYGGASTATFASLASTTVFRIVNRPTYPNSDLGKDLTKARIAKVNYINRYELNVNIDSEQIARSRAGYVPGVRDELGYQFQQRLVELKRVMGNAFLYSKAPLSSGAGFSSANPNNDYQTMWGLVPMLDGSFNTSASPVTTAATLADTTINTSVLNIFRQGADSNVVATGPNGTQRIGQLYTDRIRMEQSDTERGFFAQSFVPSMANRHYLINDLYLNDGLSSGNGIMLVLDMSRVRIKPFVGQFFYVIKAETFRDGDAVRCMSKWSLEVRNTGTDSGYAHQLTQNLS